MTQRRRLSLAWVVAVGLALLPGSARAGCHSFTVTVSPDKVPEGGTVTVTVERDGAFAVSQIDVSTVDDTATAPEDYEALEETVSFTTGTDQQFSIPIADDGAAEGPETFRVRLSNPGGCEINPNFRVGPDAVVTIEVSEAGATTPAPETTGAPGTPAPTAEAAEADDDGAPVAAVAGGVAGGAVLLALLVGYLVRRRGAGSPG